MERFDIVSLIRGVLGSMHIMIEQKEATVIFEETEPVYVWADEFKIEGERYNIIERFISVINPEYINGIVKIGDIGLVCDYEPKITEHIIKNHEGKNGRCRYCK